MKQGSMPQQEQAREKYILVVDDDPDILELAREILTHQGYHVQTSPNGARLQHIECDPPDLILLDVLLQGENGQELCRHLKAQEQTRHIPVILFSAHIAARSATEACGANDFLAKPFRIRELLDIVARWINPR